MVDEKNTPTQEGLQELIGDINAFLSSNNLIIDKAGSITYANSNKRLPATQVQKKLEDLIHPWAFHESSTRQDSPVRLMGDKGMEFVEFIKQYQDCVRKENMEKSKSSVGYPITEDAVVFVENIMKLEGITIHRYGSYIQHKKTVNMSVFETIITGHYYKYETQVSYGGLPKPKIEAVRNACKLLPTTYAADQLQELRDILKFDSTLEAKAEAIIDHILHIFRIQQYPGAPADLNKQIFKQWLWQVKRYLMGEEVAEPLLINIMGKGQGTGKSYLLKQLSKPFDFFTVPANISHMVDDRESARWTDNYIVQLEEINLGTMDARNYSSAIAVLKDKLTSDKVMYRNLGKNSHTRGIRTFSAIGSSNDNLYNLIVDPSGMRRFYEFVSLLGDASKESLTPADNQRILDIEELPALDLWKGINEHIPKGYVYFGEDNYEAMRKVQSTYHKPSVLEVALRLMEDSQVVHKDNEEVNWSDIEKMKELFATVSVKTNINTEEWFETEVEGDYTTIDLLEFSKEIRDWMKENMPESARYLPSSVANIARVMKDRGYAVLEDPRRTRRPYRVVLTAGDESQRRPSLGPASLKFS